MATIHISEAEAARDFAGLLAKVRAGAEVVIEDKDHRMIVMHSARAPRRTLREALAMMPDSETSIDDDFARDVEEARKRLNQPLDSSKWD